MFKSLYNRVLEWAKHPKAQFYLGVLSFSESSFFPIPPDVMLAPMCLAKPSMSLRFALITTVTSVLGGVFGYLIGSFAFEYVEPLIQSMGYQEKFILTQNWFLEWGFWAILIAGFSPIPYKLFTITAGLIGMVFLPFVLASVVGRGARFFLVASLILYGGEGLRATLNKQIERIGWGVTVLIIIGLIYFKFYH